MTPLEVVEDCWNRIGVNGDRSCDRLAEHTHCHNCPVTAQAARTFFERPPPAEYAAEWAESLARPAERAAPEAVSVLVFRLGGEWLGLPVRALAEVTEVRPVHRVPHRTNRVFLGLVNLRGQLQLCVSLHGLLDAHPDPEAGPRRRFVVLERQRQRWVFAADEVTGVERVPVGELAKVPGTHANPLRGVSQAVFPCKGRHVGLLDDERLVAALRGLGQ